jgi:hypothetical protein
MIVVTAFFLKLPAALPPILVKSKEEIIEELKLGGYFDDLIGMTCLYMEYCSLKYVDILSHRGWGSQQSRFVQYRVSVAVFD